MYILCSAVESPNKGHFGDNINSAVLSFVERWFGGSKCIRTIGKHILGPWPVSFVERSILYCVPISEGPLSEVPLYLHKHSWNFTFCECKIHMGKLHTKHRQELC